MRLYLSMVGVVLLAGLCAGCGGVEHAPVEGTVVLDGKPLPNARVAFSPVKATDPGPFVGMTGADGRFTLNPIGSESGGVAPGEYMLMITTVPPNPKADENTPPPKQKEIVPADYTNGSKRFTVPEGGTRDANFDMKSK